MTKFERDLKAELKKIERAIGGSFNSKSMRVLGTEAVKIIRRRTRLGFGVKGGRKQNLAGLSEAYVKMRARLRKNGKLDTTTSPRKSNLTNTGQMLRKLKVSSVKNGSVLLKTSGRRKDGKADNEQVAEWVTEQGRPWLDLSSAEEKQLARYYQNNILKPSLAKV